MLIFLISRKNEDFRQFVVQFLQKHSRDSNSENFVYLSDDENPFYNYYPFLHSMEVDVFMQLYQCKICRSKSIVIIPPTVPQTTISIPKQVDTTTKEVRIYDWSR